MRQDYAEAAKWYRQAADQGNADAQYHLGGMYHNGQGVHQDLHLSKEWFGTACNRGVQEACNQYRYLKKVIDERFVMPLHSHFKRNA